MFTWLEGLVEWIGNWVPAILIIPKTHAGVKFKWGSVVVPLDAGVHIYWPIVTSVLMHPVVRHTHDLESQALMTKDGHNVLVQVAVVCEIHDIVAALADNYDILETVGDVSRGTITECIFNHNLDDLRQDFPRVREGLEGEIGETLNEYGLTVLEVKITELSTCQTIKHAGVPVVAAAPSDS